MLSREKYLKILSHNLKNKNLIGHNLAVEAAMKALANHFKEDEELWGRVGLIHDADWEKTTNNPSSHTILTADWLQEAGETDMQIIEAVLTHNYTNTGYREPKNNMEWSLYTCDELTGLIVAVALVKGRNLASVTVESVLKKFPQKSFAAGVEREQIAMCQEKLNIELNNFIQIVLNGMQKISKDLGL
jgi:predicted hydrolase (HD superfamily)